MFVKSYDDVMIYVIESKVHLPLFIKVWRKNDFSYLVKIMYKIKKCMTRLGSSN